MAISNEAYMPQSFSQDVMAALLRQIRMSASKLGCQWQVKGGRACTFRIAEKNWSNEQYMRLDGFVLFATYDIDCVWFPGAGQGPDRIQQDLTKAISDLRAVAQDCADGALHMRAHAVQ